MRKKEKKTRVAFARRAYPTRNNDMWERRVGILRRVHHGRLCSYGRAARRRYCKVRTGRGAVVPGAPAEDRSGGRFPYRQIHAYQTRNDTIIRDLFFFYDFLTRIATRSIVPAAVGDALNNEKEKKKKKIYISPWDLDPTPRPRGPVRKKRCRGPSVAPSSSADPSNSSRITSRRDGSIEII